MNQPTFERQLERLTYMTDELVELPDLIWIMDEEDLIEYQRAQYPTPPPTPDITTENVWYRVPTDDEETNPSQINDVDNWDQESIFEGMSNEEAYELLFNEWINVGGRHEDTPTLNRRQ